MNTVLSFYQDIVFRSWTVRNPDYILLAIHGIGAHSERWQYLGEYFKNAAVYAPELRGCGDNALPTPVYSFAKLRQDIAEMCDYIRQLYPKKKIILIGESMGGLIAFDYALRQPNIAGLICLSPAFKSLLKFRWYEYLLFPLLFIFPWLKIRIHFSAGMCTEDKKVQAKLKNDHRETRSVSGGLLIAILFAQLYCRCKARKLKAPILFQLAGQDKMVSTAVSKQVFKKIPANKKMIVYSKSRHALSIEKNRNSIFRDIQKWAGSL